jgi:large subunit ribosomal protein L17
MRHNKKINHLGRTNSHRQAMLSNMASSLIKYKRIFTTTAKAKALRKYVEPLVTKSKEDTTHSRRIVFSLLQDKYAVTELFMAVSQKVGDRPGGYTRIIKTGNRLGDNAAMCFIELVDFNENMLKETKKAIAKTRRSRRKSTRGDTDKKSVALVEEVKAPVEAKPVEKVAELLGVEEVKTVAEQTTTEESQEENKAAE